MGQESKELGIRLRSTLVAVAAAMAGFALGASLIYLWSTHRAPRDENVGRRLQVVKVVNSDAPGGPYEYMPGENIWAELLVYESGPAGFTKHINCLFSPTTSIRVQHDPAKSAANPFDLAAYTWTGIDEIQVLSAAASGNYFCSTLSTEKQAIR